MPEDEKSQEKIVLFQKTLLKVYKNIEVIVFTNLDCLYISCITECITPLKDLHFYVFLILNSMLLKSCMVNFV